MLVLCYIDDCNVIASWAELVYNVNYAMQFFDSLVLTINIEMPILIPTQRVNFLGFFLDCQYDCIITWRQDETVSLFRSFIIDKQIIYFTGIVFFSRSGSVCRRCRSSGTFKIVIRQYNSHSLCWPMCKHHFFIIDYCPVFLMGHYWETSLWQPNILEALRISKWTRCQELGMLT